MGDRLRIVSWLFLLLISAGHCHCTRMSQFLDARPNPRSSSFNFMGFLPRGMPIPPSGPSRHHNSIGPEDIGKP